MNAPEHQPEGKGRRFAKVTKPYGFEAFGPEPSGLILYVNDPKCLLEGVKQMAFVEPDPLRQFSQISKGTSGSFLRRGRQPDGQLSEMSVLLAFLLLPEKPEFLRERLLSTPHLRRLQTIISLSEHDESLVHFIKKHAGARIVSLIERGGSRALRDLASLLESIESKSIWFPQSASGGRTPLTQEESHFCTALENATCEIADVPTQKSVREKWLKMRAGRDIDQFKRVRDALGFKWLPSAKRGKGRI